MDSPWLTICRIAPWVEATVPAARPSITKPMWLTRGVGHQFLDVGLDQRHQRAVDNADHRQHHNQRHEVVPGIGQHGAVEPDETVGPQLEQDAGQDDRSTGGRLDVGVGQPGVEREHGNLDGEGEAERRKTSA